MSKMISMVKRKSKRSFVKEIEIYPHSMEADSTFLVCPWILGLEHNRKDFSLRVQTYAVVAPKMALAKTLANRPQVAFLPCAENMGTVKALAPPSSIKTSYLRCPVPV